MICELNFDDMQMDIVKVRLTSFAREINYLAYVSFTRFFVIASKLSSQMGRGGQNILVATSLPHSAGHAAVATTGSV